MQKCYRVSHINRRNQIQLILVNTYPLSVKTYTFSAKTYPPAESQRVCINGNQLYLSQFECVDDFGVKPANLLLNFGYSVGFIERFGVRCEEDSRRSFHNECFSERFPECPWTVSKLYTKPPWCNARWAYLAGSFRISSDYFSIEVQKLMNSQHYDGKCFTRDQLCR